MSMYFHEIEGDSKLSMSQSPGDQSMFDQHMPHFDGLEASFPNIGRDKIAEPPAGSVTRYSRQPTVLPHLPPRIPADMAWQMPQLYEVGVGMFKGNICRKPWFLHVLTMNYPVIFPLSQ